MGVTAIIAASAVIGAGASIYSANQQRKAASEARKIQQRQSEAERRRAIRQAVNLRSQALAQGVATGAAGGSGLAGSVSSLTSQVGTNLGLGTELSGIAARQAAYQSKAQLGADIANISGDLMKMASTIPSGATLKDVISGSAFKPQETKFQTREEILRNAGYIQ